MKELCDFARDNWRRLPEPNFPPYYHRYDGAAMEQYFVRAASLAPDMPVYLYNMPGMTHNPLTPDVLKKSAPSVKMLWVLRIQAWII